MLKQTLFRMKKRIKRKWMFLLCVMVTFAGLSTSIISLLHAYHKIDIVSSPSPLPLYGLILSLVAGSTVSSMKTIRCSKVLIGLQILMAVLFVVELAGMFIQYEHMLNNVVLGFEWYGTVALAILSLVNLSFQKKKQRDEEK